MLCIESFLKTLLKQGTQLFGHLELTIDVVDAFARGVWQAFTLEIVEGKCTRTDLQERARPTTTPLLENFFQQYGLEINDLLVLNATKSAPERFTHGRLGSNQG